MNLGLNSIVKFLMYLIGGEMFAMNIIGLFTFAYMTIWQDHSFYPCTIFALTRYFNYQAQSASIALVSQIRFYIGWKATKTKKYSKKLIRGITLAVYLFGPICSGIGYLILANYGQLSGINTCMSIGVNDEGISLPTILINVPTILTYIIVGLVGDIFMVILIRKRKKMVDPRGHQLVPWKSTTKGEEFYDMKIPIRATILSLVNLALAVFFIILVAFILDLQYGRIVVSISQVSACGAFLFMIFKVIKTKKSAPKVPIGLQRHGENVDDLEDKVVDVSNEHEVPASNQNTNESQMAQDLQSHEEPFEELVLNPLKLQKDIGSKVIYVKSANNDL